jgi:tryptophan synthase beta chain
MFQLCAKLEGIIPALEPAHALARAVDKAAAMDEGAILLMNMCGRGDKDIFSVMELIGR